MMLLSVFPDSRSVLLLKRIADSGSSADGLSHASKTGVSTTGGDSDRGASPSPASPPERRTHYVLPSADRLRALGLAIPDGLWGYAERGGEPVSGLFLDAARLEHLLAVQGTSVAGDGRRSAPGLPPGGDASASHEQLTVVGRRQAADLMEIDDYWHMNRAFHLADWDRRTRFCGSCAAPMERSDVEISKVCPSCGLLSYPQIAPAVIMAVVHDGKILLAHNRRHPGHMFSVLAGFVEAGETLEHAVSREVHEESGVLVRNIEYFSSQPWPFPNSLMVAFTAEYAGGNLRPDDDEIDEMGWFAPADIPAEIPSSYSVARRLIEWFVTEYGTTDDLNRILATGNLGTR